MRRRLSRFQKASISTPAPRPSIRTAEFAYYGLGNFESARNSMRKLSGTMRGINGACQLRTTSSGGTQTQKEKISKLKASYGDVMAYQYAAFYAQRGENLKALEWLETALRLRDAGLESLKTDSIMDPIRQEPRFKAVIPGVEDFRTKVAETR